MRRAHRRVNTQRSNRFAARRPLSSITLAVSEKASRIRLVGRTVTAPTPDQGDESDGRDDAALTLSGRSTATGRCAPASAVGSSAGSSAATAGAADPRPAIARLASAGPPVRASSIIPSNRPRIETPRRAASASTQARRSWSRRMPTTVDFEVAMAPLTVIPGVYIGGRRMVAARWWAPGNPTTEGSRYFRPPGPHGRRTAVRTPPRLSKPANRQRPSLGASRVEDALPNQVKSTYSGTPLWITADVRPGRSCS